MLPPSTQPRDRDFRCAPAPSSPGTALSRGWIGERFTLRSVEIPGAIRSPWVRNRSFVSCRRPPVDTHPLAAHRILSAGMYRHEVLTDRRFTDRGLTPLQISPPPLLYGTPVLRQNRRPRCSEASTDGGPAEQEIGVGTGPHVPLNAVEAHEIAQRGVWSPARYLYPHRGAAGGPACFRPYFARPGVPPPWRPPHGRQSSQPPCRSPQALLPLPAHGVSAVQVRSSATLSSIFQC